MVALTLQELVVNDNMADWSQKVPQELNDYGSQARKPPPELTFEVFGQNYPAVPTVTQSNRKRAYLLVDRKISETKSEGRFRTEDVASRNSDLKVASSHGRDRQGRFITRSEFLYNIIASNLRGDGGIQSS